VTDEWVELQLKMEHDGAISQPATIYLRFEDLTDSGAGFIYVDQFTVFEYEDEAPPSACTLDIDLANTVVTDETVALAEDGSITVAITGGTAPVEYSLDGVNWQSSEQFTGLAPGVYTIYVQDADECTDQEAVTVNAGSLDFDFTAAVTHETVSGANDGRIEVTVTGTGGPFTFSKNGGSSYQSSNIFLSLAPGAYTVVVKDAGDNTRAKIVLVNAGSLVVEGIQFSKNPVVVTLYTTGNYAEDNYQLMADVRVETVAGSGVYESMMKVAKYPDDVSGPLKAVSFNLRAAFRGVLDAVPPTLNAGAITKLTDRVKAYRVFYGDIWDDMAEPLSWTGATPQLALLGGVAKQRWPGLLFFTSYLPATKMFMTWAPTVKEVDALQEDYLAFMVYSAGISQVKLMVKAYFDDDTTETVQVTTRTCQYGDLLQVPSGPANTGATVIDVEKNLVKYDLWLNDQGDSAASEVRTYKISDYKRPDTRYLLWLNSLGAYEVLRCTGQSEETAEMSRVQMRRYLPDYYAATDGEYATVRVNRRNTEKMSTGYLTGPMAQDWLEYLQDFLHSTRVYDITDGTRTPVTVQADKAVVKRAADNQRFVRFEVERSYVDEVYTS
jgi:hypothetical protein